MFINAKPCDQGSQAEKSNFEQYLDRDKGNLQTIKFKSYFCTCFIVGENLKSSGKKNLNNF